MIRTLEQLQNDKELVKKMKLFLENKCNIYRKLPYKTKIYTDMLVKEFWINDKELSLEFCSWVASQFINDYWN